MMYKKTNKQKSHIKNIFLEIPLTYHCTSTIKLHKLANHAILVIPDY